MTFHSILFEGADQEFSAECATEPAFFNDLNLDQFVNRVTTGWEEYNLAPFYYTRLGDLQTIIFRQQIVRDLEPPTLFQAIKSFSAQMQAMRRRIDQAKQFFYERASQRGFLGAVEIYCAAVERLTLDICSHEPKSQGLILLQDYLAHYVSSAGFRALVTETEALKADLATIKYCLLIKGDTITVRNPEDEDDYSVSVEETFKKFRRNADQRFRIEVRQIEGVNHIQAQVLDGLATLHPDTFETLKTFCTIHANYLDPVIARFDREVQFYMAYLTFMNKLRIFGLNFCLPELSQTAKAVEGHNVYDLVLAAKLVDDKATAVCNDFTLSGAERIFVVTGPNHGGKTTFARMFGQMHYLASLGLPVPGTEARLFLFDRLFTHFERHENVANLRGKLQDDLVRIRSILDKSTPNSVIIMNEIFASTTLQDATFLSRQIITHLSSLDLLCVCVTFLDELASLNEKTVSIVSTVDPDNPAIRTFKLERRPADGLAYALAIAQKHRVTYGFLKERIPE